MHLAQTEEMAAGFKNAWKMQVYVLNKFIQKQIALEF